MAALEPNRMAAESIEDFRGRLLYGLGHRSDVRLEPRALFGDLRREAGVANKEAPISPQDQVAAVAAETRQVRDIDRIADQKRIQPLLAKPSRQPPPSSRHMIHEQTHRLTRSQRRRHSANRPFAFDLRRKDKFYACFSLSPSRCHGFGAPEPVQLPISTHSPADPFQHFSASMRNTTRGTPDVTQAGPCYVSAFAVTHPFRIPPFRPKAFAARG